jgi:hypothetical protein
METEKILIVCATVLLLVGMGSCTAGNFDRREKWAEAVKNGADPMAVTCALSGADATAEHIICYALANKK